MDGVPGTAVEVEEDSDDGADGGKGVSYQGFSFSFRALVLGLLHSAGVFYVPRFCLWMMLGAMGGYRLCAQYIPVSALFYSPCCAMK